MKSGFYNDNFKLCFKLNICIYIMNLLKQNLLKLIELAYGVLAPILNMGLWRIGKYFTIFKLKSHI